MLPYHTSKYNHIRPYSDCHPRRLARVRSLTFRSPCRLTLIHVEILTCHHDYIRAEDQACLGCFSTFISSSIVRFNSLSTLLWRSQITAKFSRSFSPSGEFLPGGASKTSRQISVTFTNLRGLKDLRTLFTSRSEQIFHTPFATQCLDANRGFDGRYVECSLFVIHTIGSDV